MDMIRETFNRELNELQDNVLIMGSMVEKAVARSVDALKNRALGLAEQVVGDDEIINQKRFEIEEDCVRLIATQQPMAGDLRTILSVLSIVTDLERMGDYAAGIAEITLLLRDDPSIKPLVDIPRMSAIGIDMLHESLKAFVDKDANKAREIATRDDEVDSLYNKVLSKCITAMVEDPNTVPVATRIIWVAHKLERISDRVTNICERVIFTITGKMEELDSG
jgi:phosphate transport system protein